MIFKSVASKLLSMRRFSLRTFLILVLLLGCGFGFLARWHRTVILPGNAQLRIQAKSGVRPKLVSNPARRASAISFISHAPDLQQSWLRPFLRKWVHSEYEHHFGRVHFMGNCVDDLDLAKDFAMSNGVERVMFDADQVSPEFAAEFFRTPKIRKLDLQRLPRTPPESKPFFRYLTQAKALESLSLGESFLSEEAAMEIAKLPNLKELTLDSCTPEAMSRLAKCNSLEQLSIRTLRSSEQNFRAPQETEIIFAQRARRSMKEFLTAMSKSPNLKSLSITGTLGLKPEDLREFCTNSQVERLGLYDPTWSPECLAEIARLPRLESLRLYDLNLQDEHLKMLYQVKSLKSLTIGPNISPEAIKALKGAIPDCKVGRY